MSTQDLLENTEKTNTELQQINQLLLESNEVLNNYIDVSKTDLEGNITYVSKMFCETMGYSKDELIGKSHNIVRSPYSNESLYKELWENINENKTFSAVMQNRSKSGDLIWFEVLIKPEFDIEGKKTGYVAYRKNITEQKTLKALVDDQIEQIRQKDIQLHEQAKIAAMGNMINNIAHQWRQPLSLISSVASSLSLKLELGVFDTDEAITNLEELNKSVQFLSNTINDFSNLFQKDKDFSPVDLEKAIDNVLMTLQVPINNLKIKINDNYPKDTIIINTFKSDLIQALLNIIKNALDVIQNNNENERVITIDILENNESADIKICDNGGGIPEDILNRIVEPYFTTKHQSQGTGLGLYMTNEIITKLLKGSLDISNENVEFEGKIYKGACFRITLPKAL